MKQFVLHIIFVLTCTCDMMAQTIISGTVMDGDEPLEGVNVFIHGTIDGCISDSLGRFSFITSSTDKVLLKATFFGYKEYVLTANVNDLHDISISMQEQATSIDEVVVTASTFIFGKNESFKKMDALDIVMSANSCGDIMAALQSLPGTHTVAEDGKLYVRGGDSNECQTFVNGMHVLVPYSTNTENSATRGRFSPFLFKGINFSLGGYGGEYGQALSSVLPMETTDAATNDKFGISASLVDWSMGGTKAFESSSLSFNASLTSMGLYNRMFSERYDFISPYRKLSGEAQYKKEFHDTSVLKSYVGYDLTTVGQRIDGRKLSLREHNVYANVTYRADMGHGYSLFTGIANSSVFNDIDDALTIGDHYNNHRNEIHLKAEIRKVCSDAFKLSVGIEDFIRSSTLNYENTGYRLDYNILAAHLDAQLRIMPHVFLNASARHETTEGSHLFLPRATLSYIPNNHLQVSLVAGRYSQTAEDEYMARGMKRQSTTEHVILSTQYKAKATLMRVEAYHKDYHHLPLLAGDTYQAMGYGMSKGVDVYVEDHSLSTRLTTTISYSLNDSERFYLDFTKPQTPSYASRHNLRLAVKYSLGKLILGMADSFASGRQFQLGKTPCYNSIDMNLTYLVSPKVIVYTSMNNILGRTNVSRYDTQGHAIVPTRDRFFYIGIFVSLKNNKAYEISNF